MSKNNNIHEFTQLCRKIDQYMDNPKTEAEKLRSKILAKNKMKEEYLTLQEEIKNFMKSDASNEDKKMLRGYTESLSMICSAINEKLI